jgi:hypothetical protein
MSETFGPELVVNGGFDTNTDWTKDLQWVISGGKAVCTGDDNGCQLYQPSSLVLGKDYLVQVDFHVISGDYGPLNVTTIALGFVNFVPIEGHNSQTINYTVGDNRVTVAATLENTVVFSIDNVSVKEVLTVPSGVDYYIVKRNADIINYILDPLVLPLSIAEDASLLADGEYEYTLTPVSEYGVEGAPGDALTLSVVDGIYQFNPNADPTGLTVTPAIAGKFDLTWHYPIAANTFSPEKFNIYCQQNEDVSGFGYSSDLSNWTKAGELTYAPGRFRYTTTEDWIHGTTVYFKVQPVKGSFEKTNTASVSAVADTTGPTVAAPEISMSILVQ